MWKQSTPRQEQKEGSRIPLRHPFKLCRDSLPSRTLSLANKFASVQASDPLVSSAHSTRIYAMQSDQSDQQRQRSLLRSQNIPEWCNGSTVGFDPSDGG